MRLLVLNSFLAIFAYNTSVSAELPQPDDWQEMSDICEAIIFEQDESVFDGLTPANPLVKTEGFRELAVAHESSSLVASAVADGQEWFMCLVENVPGLPAKNAAPEILAWIDTQFGRALSPSYIAVYFNDKSTLPPVRVRCREADGLTAVLAFISEGEFRIGVTNSLPKTVENPCQ